MTTMVADEAFPSTLRVVGVKIRNCGEVKKMGAGDADLRAGDRVMLELDGHLTYGVVHLEPQAMPFIPQMRVMRGILRRATAEDEATIERHERIAREARAYCRERATALGLRMKLVEVFCSFQRREITFVYTADGRVDFRQLVKDLARRFGGRIEMRQIGSREEAKRLGGVDSCGLVLCCASFMTEFTPVGVKKARAAGMDLSESRLIGVCGRLKCCLMFDMPDVEAGSSAHPLIHPSRSSGEPPSHRSGRSSKSSCRS
jgi:cell fate regulator YaaT (PSP1 superfamily)